jgi:hypothetical protein
MGNLAELKHIVHAALILAFSDLACADGVAANELMQRYPDYRSAKDLVDHTFWAGAGMKMLAEVNLALAKAEQRYEFDLDECA